MEVSAACLAYLAMTQQQFRQIESGTRISTFYGGSGAREISPPNCFAQTEAALPDGKQRPRL